MMDDLEKTLIKLVTYSGCLFLIRTNKELVRVTYTFLKRIKHKYKLSYLFLIGPKRK